MSNSSSSSSGGIGFAGLLCIAFIVLKLTGYIDWSLWWVTSPIWIPIAILILGFGVYIMILWVKSKLKKKSDTSNPLPKLPLKESKFQQRIHEMYEERNRRP